MNTDMGFDLMEKLLPHVTAIVTDEDVVHVKELLRKEDTIQVGKAMHDILPLFLGKHREHMYAIAAITAGKTVEEIKQQPLADTLQVMRESVTGDMLSFFGLCLRMAMSA